MTLRMENGAKVGGEQEAGAGLHRALTRSRVDSVLWRWTLTLRRFCSALGLICGGFHGNPEAETPRLQQIRSGRGAGVDPKPPNRTFTNQGEELRGARLSTRAPHFSAIPT